MTLTLEINGIDFTAKWRPYESHWTRRAYMGEASGESEFVIDDDDGTIDHADFATYKVVRVWEDASGADFCMFEGRITTKRLGRGPLRTGVAMRWVITAADSNYELRGIRITDSNRPIETDRERVLAMRAAYLDGVGSTNSHARDTTDMDGTFVEAADLIDLPAETYTDTFPDEVFRRIAEMAAKTFFVFIDGDAIKHLYYAAFDDDQIVADISITDDGTADSIDSYAPDVSDSSGLHDGLQVVTGGSVRYADDQFYEASDVAGGEADHDKWEEHWHDDFLNTENDAERFITNTVASRSNEDFTFTVTWLMTADNAHRLQAGYMTSIRLASANVPTPIDQRASQVSHQPLYPDADGEAVYRVTADFGLPRGRPFARHVRTKPGPTPPTQPVPEACTRLYFSQDAAGYDPVMTGAWDSDQAGPAFEGKVLKSTSDSTYSGTGTGSTASSGGSAQNMRLGEHVYELGAATAAILAAGGGTFRMQARTRSRYGVGISEAAQDNISQISLRVLESDGTPRGFAYAGHSLSSSAGSVKWAAQSLHRNSTFPPAAADNTLTAVSVCVAGDLLLVETGYRSFTVGTTGAAMLFTSNSGFDLPEDDNSTSVYNAWLEICSGESAGSETEPVGGSGEGSPGTSGTYSPIDHVHEHGILDPDDIHMHAEYQVHQMHTNSGSDPTVTDDADDGYSRGWTWNNTTTGDVYFLRDSTAGAADWVAISGGGANDLDDLGDVDLTSPVPSDLDVLTYDSGSSTWKPAAAAAAADHDHTGGGDGGDLDSPVIDGYAVFNEESAPSSAASGTVRLYAKSDGRIYSKDDGGIEYGPFDVAGAGSPGSPFVAAQASTSITSNGTSHVVNLPTGIVTGQLLLMIAGLDGAATISATGWTTVSGVPQQSSTNCSIDAMYRFADGSEGSTITVTSSASEKAEYWVGRFSTAHASSPPEGVGFPQTVASGDHNPPSLTPSWGSAANLWLAVAVGDTSSDATYAYVSLPVPYSHIYSVAPGVVDSVTLIVTGREFTGTNQDPQAFRYPSGEQYCTATFAIRPA